MFKSATIRLTVWYLAILMVISLTFSAVIYQITSVEIQRRLERFQTSLQYREKQPDSYTTDEDVENIPPPTKITTIRNNEQEQAQNSILLQLVYVNLWILVIGGFLSYFLARHHLKPIEEAHAAQSRFTSDASHEFRTPLAVMKTEIEVALRDNTTDTTELRDVLSSNLEEVNKLTKLSTMLLNLSRLDNNPLEFSVINFNKIADDAVLSFHLSTKRLSIKKTKTQNPIYGNEAAIFDLIKILIDNAVKYSEPNSKIQLKLSRYKDQAKLEITNTGIGITSEKITHIFERFYRADESRTNKVHTTKSYGLGLALAKKIVDLHHGKINVVSTPGKTTTFTVLIPTIAKSKAKTKK